MKINAYILAADPAWIEASVLSYYNLADRIVVSYDQDSLGWTGVPVDVEQCLNRLKRIDRDNKFDYRPGHFARKEFFATPMQNDTHQRQVALDQASDGADWVLQLDTDEILPDCMMFKKCIGDAISDECDGLTWPSRGMSHRISKSVFLEIGARFWRPRWGRQAPYAVKSHSQLNHSRRCDGKIYHVDCRRKQSVLQYPHVEYADKVIRPSKALIHMSWVRPVDLLEKKLNSWSHAYDKDWSSSMKRWHSVARHPLLAVITSQFERGLDKRHLRVTTVPLPLLEPSDRYQQPQSNNKQCE
jgi:hypothetical protein